MEMEIIMGLAKKLMEYAAQFSTLYPFRTHVSCVVFGQYNLHHRDRTDSDKQTTLRVYVSELEIQKTVRPTKQTLYQTARSEMF